MDPYLAEARPPTWGLGLLTGVLLPVAFALYAGLKDDVWADEASTQGLALSSWIHCSGKALSQRLMGLPQMIPLAFRSCPANPALISSSVKEPVPYEGVLQGLGAETERTDGRPPWVRLRRRCR